MLRNSESQFGTVAKALHWLTFLLMLGGVGLALSMVDLPLSPRKLKVYSWHKWIGVTIFLLTALRVLWRWLSPPPPPLATTALWQRRAAASVHTLIYLLLIVVPLSGWLMSSALGFPTVYLGVVKLPDLIAKNKALGEELKLLHFILNKVLLAAIALHVLAAIKHHFVDRDATLKRMLPFAAPQKG